MMLKAWRGLEEVSFSFFKVTQGKKLSILTWIEGFQTVITVLIHKQLQNDA